MKKLKKPNFPKRVIVYEFFARKYLFSSKTGEELDSLKFLKKISSFSHKNGREYMVHLPKNESEFNEEIEFYKNFFHEELIDAFFTSKEKNAKYILIYF